MGDAQEVMRLCDFVRALNSTMATRRSGAKAAAPKYWFSEHHPQNENTNRKQTVTSHSVNSRLERVRRAALAALGVRPDPVNMTQIGIGPAWSGAPLHLHAAGFSLALMGSRRWLLIPEREGVWSN